MNINQIKENFTCLDYLGEPLKNTSSGWHIYRCPWKTDTHPSLTVSPDGKVWRDLSTGAEGGIIELVMACLNTRDFKQVCAAFDSSSFSLSKTFGGKKEKEPECNKFASFSVMPLQSRGLYAYLTKRKINASIARQFLQEAHYSFQERTDGSYLYALAYQNDKGGFELRGAPYHGNEKGYKGGTRPKGITTHLLPGNHSVVVFEGFFDSLSLATLTGGQKQNYLVLNSVANVESGILSLKSHPEFSKIFLALDNDKAGRNASERIKAAIKNIYVEDLSGRFAPHKDLNDYLIHH